MAIQTLSLQISDNASTAAANIDRLTAALQRLRGAISGGGVMGHLAAQLQNLSQSTGFGQQLDRIAKAVERTNTLLVNMTNILNSMRASTMASSTAMNSLASSIAGMASKMTALGPSTTNNIKTMNVFNGTVKMLGASVPKTSKALEGLKTVLGGVTDRIGGLIHTFGRLVLMRTFRYIIRQVATAFREGLENVRAYSKAINGLYDKDMTGLDNQLLKLKNSLGAALAPAIQALLPLIRTFTSYIIQAANAFNQFMALMNGQSQWTKAIDVVASDFEKTEKSATGAAKAAKNLLASWDELNIIQSQAGGGGSGSGNKADIDYTKMFTEVFTFDNNVVRFVNTLKENLPIVQGLLAGIAGLLIGMPGWTVAAIIGVTATFSNAIKIGEEGLTMDNVRGLLLSALASGLGGAFIGWHFGGWSGALLGAIIGFSVSAGIQLLVAFSHGVATNNPEEMIVSGLGLAAAGAGLFGTVAGFLGDSILIGAVNGLAAAAGLMLFVAFQNAIETNDAGTAVFTGLGLTAVTGWLGGQIAKAAPGTGMGKHIVGAVGGLAVGAALMFYAGFLDAEKTNNPEQALVNGLGLVASTTVAGASFGLMFGHPVIGALVGLAVGAAVTLITHFTVDGKSAASAIVVSQEELQRIVNANFFTIDVDATIRKINVTLDEERAAKRDIEDSLTNVNVAFNIIKLGVKDKESYQNLYDAVFADETGLISRLNTAIQKEQQVVRLSFSLIPTADSQTLLTSGIQGWEGVQEYVGNLGQDLSHWLAKGIDEGLTAEETAIVESLLTTLTDISRIIAESEVTLTAETNLMRNIRSSDMTLEEAFAQYHRDLEMGLLDVQVAGVHNLDTLAAVYQRMAQAEEAKGTEEGMRNAQTYWANYENYSTRAASARAAMEEGKDLERQLYAYSASGREIVLNNWKASHQFERTRSIEEAIGLFSSGVYGNGANNIESIFELMGFDIGSLRQLSNIGISPLELLTPEELAVFRQAFPAQSESNIGEAEQVNIDATNGTVNTNAPIESGGGFTSASGDSNLKNGTDARYQGGGDGTRTDFTEQVVLERQMVELLRQLLNKPLVAQIGASSALGRTVEQSMAMWGSRSGTNVKELR